MDVESTSYLSNWASELFDTSINYSSEEEHNGLTPICIKTGKIACNAPLFPTTNKYTRIKLPSRLLKKFTIKILRDPTRGGSRWCAWCEPMYPQIVEVRWGFNESLGKNKIIPENPPMPKIADGVETARTRRGGTGTAMAAGVGRGDDEASAVTRRYGRR